MDNSCGDHGRAYDFEHAWDASPVRSSDLSNAARDLYRSFTSSPNNVGAAVTSAGTKEALSILKAVKNDILDVSVSKLLLTKVWYNMCNFS